jgi:hypothetical protein
MKEVLSTNDIALLQNVSTSRVRQIWCHYRITKTIPILAKPGRPSRKALDPQWSLFHHSGEMICATELTPL